MGSLEFEKYYYFLTLSLKKKPTRLMEQTEGTEKETIHQVTFKFVPMKENWQ